MGIAINETSKSKKGTCHCFTCNETLDLLDLISYVYGYNDGGLYGKKWVQEVFGGLEEQERTVINIVPEPTTLEKNYVSNTVVNMYAQKIPNYVLNRGISLDVASYFNVGYDDTCDAAVFPVYDIDGVCRFLQRRGIGFKFFRNDEGADKDSALYGLYQVMEQYTNQTGLLDFTKLYVTESIIDALYLWSHNKPAIATMQAIPTKKQLEIINSLPFKKLVAAQDNDEAGHKGANVLRDRVRDKLVERLVFPPNTKDVNDLSTTQIEQLMTTIIF